MPIKSSSLLSGGGSSGISLRSLNEQTSSRQSLLPKSYDWLNDQEWNPDRFSSAYSSTRPGTLGGGFTFPQMATLASSRPVTPDPPRLTQSILNGKTGSAASRVGQLSIKNVATFDFLAELTSSYIGQEQPLIGEQGAWFDPYAFFSQPDKGIDFNNAPSRLADYMVAGIGLPYHLAATLSGLPLPTLAPRDQQYQFQLSPNYWPYVTGASDEELTALAWKVVAKTADPATNQYQVDALITQFKIDRNKRSALTSGSDSADYFAKKAATWASRKGPLPENPGGIVAASMGYLYDEKGESIAAGVAGFFRNVPFLSHAWASTLNPLNAKDEALWKSLTPQQRSAMLGAVGSVQTINEAPGMLLGFAAGGTVAGSLAAGVKGTATLGGKALQVYSTVLNLSKASMALGVTNATALWASSAAFPDNEMIQNLVTRIDRSRPISDSHLAGAVNLMGMFSSGTFGINTAVRMNARVAAMAGAKMPVGIETISRGALGGMPNLRTYEYGFGGSRMADFMVENIGLPLHEVKVGVQRTFLSYTLNSLRRMNDEGWVAALDNPAGTPLAGMTTDQILELQAMHAAHSLETVTNQAEGILRVMAKAREDQPLGLWTRGDDAIKGFAIAVRNARSWDDNMARSFINDYASPFITRLTGADTGEAMRTWMAAKIVKLGYSADALPAAKSWSTEKWRQATRLLYQFDFNRWADTVNAAAGSSEEASRISIMSLRHLFRDEAATALKVLRGEDEAAALAMMEKIKTKIELEAWDASEIRATVRKGPGTPIWEATPAKMADHIEDIYETLSAKRSLADPADPTALDALNYVHAEMEKEGLWTIGFKPVNEAGDFVLSVQTRTGHIVESRWLDYPLDNQHLVDLGNRGYLSAKFDDVTRGFRTWRLLEYQKGSLFRSLTERTDLSATQIESFHQGVMDLARKHNVSPQAIGRLPRQAPGLRSVSQEVNDLAERVFGGVVKDKNGAVVNWKKEVGNAYRQAYRLNLTAGLTSHLKSSFGPVGEWALYGSDALYVMWRFGMSPLFKAGEIWESAQLNLMRRVYPGQDPYVMSLYSRYGAGSDPTIIASERTLDPFIAGMDSTVPGTTGIRNALAPANVRVVNSSMAGEAAQRRAAQSLAFYSRGMPENQAQVVARTAMREHAARFRAEALGGEALRTTDRGRLMAEVANSVDETGALLAGTDEARLRQVLRQLNREDLDPAVREALDAHPWGVPTSSQLARAADLDRQAEMLRTPPTAPYVENVSENARHAYPGVYADTPGYLYHSLDQDAFDAIVASGEIRANSNYVTNELSGYGTIQLRVKSDHPAFSNIDQALLNAKGYITHGSRTTGIGLSIGRVDNASVEFFAADGTWRPLLAARPMSDDARLVVWRQMIADGHAAPDAALALRDRYDELLAALRAEREANRAYARNGLLTINTGARPDWTDPVTGQAVLRDATNATESEFEHAIRSMAGRRKNVKVTVPSPEDLSIRLEAAAEAARQPRPTFRSDHVGPIDSVPADFTMDPVELHLDTEINTSLDPAVGLHGQHWDPNGNFISGNPDLERHGTASWIDLNTYDPANGELLHVTTAADAVMDTGGLVSRMEVAIRMRPPDMVEALRVAHQTSRASEIKITLTSGGSIYYASEEHLRNFVSGEIGLMYDFVSGQKLWPHNIAEIKNSNTGDVLWKRPPGGLPRVPEGLSAGNPDVKVSFTTNREAAETIATNYQVGGMAARGEIDGQGVLDHYIPFYERLIQRSIDEGIYVLPMKTHYVMPEQMTLREAALDEIHKAMHVQRNGTMTAAEMYDNLVAEFNGSTYPADPGLFEWELFDRFDRDLAQEKTRVGLGQRKDIFSGQVVFAGGRDAARYWDERQVAVLRVAIRRNKVEVLDEAVSRAAANEAFRISERNVRIVFTGGGVRSFPRWPKGTPQWAPDGSLIPFGEVKVNGMTEAEAFQDFLEDVYTEARLGPPDSQISGVVAGTNTDDIVLAGMDAPDWNKSTRPGKDSMEIEAHSDNIYTIDNRIDGEPLATDAEGLLRQLRQVSDENGNPIPGYERRYDRIVHDADQMRSESLNPDPVTSLEDIASEPAGMTRNLRERMADRYARIKGKGAEMGDEFFDPVPGKERKMDALTIQMQREEFPRVISGTGAETVFRDLGIPEQQQADFLVTDRDLLERWQTTGDADDLRALIDHAGSPEDRAQLDAFYASEEWDVVSGLWRLNLRGASEEAFGVHFFDQYRSPLLRGMNHPVLGVYPAAWALKTAREWAKFLFDNRMFGVDLRLGMTPAVAVANITRSQQIAFAQDNPDYEGTLDDFMREGPLGSTIFVFNLLMPGDWSSLPFPLSRTLREVLRGNISPGDILAKNVQYMGVTRDIRLLGEVGGEIKDLAFPPEPEPNVPRPRTWTSTPKSGPRKWYDIPTR